MNDADIVKVVQAHIDGKLVQYRRKNTDYDAKWIDCVSNHLWDFVNIDYRVKQEPRKFLLYDNTQDDVYGFEITHKDDAEIERIKGGWINVFEVMEITE